MGQYKGILEENEWVKRLTELVHGNNNVDAADIRTIGLLVNRGVSAWLKQRSEKSPTIALLGFDAQKFIDGLEKWQI
jgi:hypothetical protein